MAGSCHDNCITHLPGSSQLKHQSSQPTGGPFFSHCSSKDASLLVQQPWPLAFLITPKSIIFFFPVTFNILDDLVLGKFYNFISVCEPCDVIFRWFICICYIQAALFSSYSSQSLRSTVPPFHNHFILHLLPFQQLWFIVSLFSIITFTLPLK